MKNVFSLIALATLMTALGGAPAYSQTPTGEIRGTVTDSNKPLAGATVTLANVYSGKSFKVKTDDFGNFAIQDAPYGYYDVEVASAEGDRLLQQQISIMPAESSRTATVKIDVSQSKTTSVVPNDPDTYGGIRTLPEPNTKNKRKLNKEIQEQNKKVSETNALILQANAAVLDKRWKDALAPLEELTGMEPDNWEYLVELGDTQANLGEYQEAIGSYESGILAAGDVSGIDVKTMAYFNLCVTQYNLRNVEGTVAACDKAISTDPGKAEAYYFKGALLLYANQPALTGKVTAPPSGAAEALKKYLELSPDGEHANGVRQMLNYLAALGRAAAGNGKKN